MAIGFVNTISYCQPISSTYPTTFAKAITPQRPTSGSVLSSQLTPDMSPSHLLKMLLAAYIQYFASSISLHQRSTGSTIFLASCRSFRTFTGYKVYEVRLRYNLPSCQGLTRTYQTLCRSADHGGITTPMIDPGLSSNWTTLLTGLSPA